MIIYDNGINKHMNEIIQFYEKSATTRENRFRAKTACIYLHRKLHVKKLGRVAPALNEISKIRRNIPRHGNKVCLCQILGKMYVIHKYE